MPPSPKERDLLTRKQVAELLEISITTLKRWEKKGLLRPVHIGPKLIRYRAVDVAALIKR